MKYNFIYVSDTEQLHRVEAMGGSGFNIVFEGEYLGGGNGRVTLGFCNIDDEFWDVPSIEMSFDDSSEDLTGLIECTCEIVRWCKENKPYIDSLKAQCIAMG